MKSNSKGPFAFRLTGITHRDTGQKLPFIRISAKVVDRTSVAVVVEFCDAPGRQRREELSWLEYRNWSKFQNKMMSVGYRCDNPPLLKSLHSWYLERDIPRTIHLRPAAGWWRGIGTDKKFYFLNTGIVNWCSQDLGLLHKGSCGQPTQYGFASFSSNPASRQEIATWYKEIAPACGRSPALMVGALSELAAMLFPAARDFTSFCIFYGADEAVDREVIRSVAACVLGAPRNFSILGKSPTPLQLAKDFRHNAVCFDISSRTEKQILPFFESALGINGEISCDSSLPSDMRLLAFVTGPCGHLDNMRVPWAISVSGIVDPETRLYDDLPVSCTPDQMNAWISSLTRQQKGAVRQRFVDLIERNQSKAFQIEITHLIDDCIKRLNPKTKDERTRALEVAQLWVAGCLGIKWRILPWKVERLERVLEQLFAASCKSLPDLQALEATAVEKLDQHLREAKKLRT